MTEQGGFFSKFNRGQFKEAADMLKEKSEKEGKDQILFLLDRGAALFEARDYKNAIDVLTKAERLTEIKDYTSINEEVVSVVTTDNFKRYYPLDYELIMINVYLAVSYYMTGSYDDALVECRRINNLVYKLNTKGMKTFEEIPVAWYISASIYEKQKKFDDAFIDYKRVTELLPGFKEAVFDAYRTARLSGNRQSADELDSSNKELGLKQYFKSLNSKKNGTVVVLYFDGEIPIKRPDPHNSMLPKFYTRSFDRYRLVVKDVAGQDLGSTSEIMDLEAVARKNLDERIGRIMAKRLLGVATKVAIGYGVAKATDNDAIGVLAGLLLHATTTPDLREWSTLPRSFQSLRFTLPAGEQKIVLVPNKGVKQEITLKILPGDTNIVLYRSL